MPVIKVLDSMRVPEWVWLERAAPTAADGAISYSINDLGNITVEAMRDGTIPYWLQLP